MNFPATCSPSAPLLAGRMDPAEPPSPLRRLTSGLMRGDDEAWLQFHREYGPGMFRQLLAATRGDHALASEALQQAYLRIARHARLCESEAMFAGWLRIVGRSALQDCWRRRRSFWNLLQRWRAEPEAEEAPGGEDRLLRALDGALPRLSGDDRALLEAKYFRARSLRELAQELAVSEKAVESRLTRARAELRRHLLSALSRHDEA